MATLQTIRNRGGLLVSIVIGLALVAFLVGDALSSAKLPVKVFQSWITRIKSLRTKKW